MFRCGRLKGRLEHAIGSIRLRWLESSPCSAAQHLILPVADTDRASPDGEVIPFELEYRTPTMENAASETQ